MPEKISGIQPEVLRWARESLGLSTEDVAHSLKRDSAEIEEWESGSSAPTYAQLEKLAYTIYKRPLAVFFLPEPPQEPRVEQQFRTLPDFELDRLAADTRYQLRMGHAFRLSLMELNDGVNSSRRKIFRDLHITIAANVRQAAASIREYLGVSVADQSSWRSSEDALKKWRNLIEEVGVFVFKHAFKQEDISGFCLAHDEFPIIYLNNSTSKTRQTFTLFHELAHVLLSISAISKMDEAHLDHLPKREEQIERFCNGLATEILVPSGDFGGQIAGTTQFDDVALESLADRYWVSREVVLRRLLDRGLVTATFYRTKVAQWKEQAGKRKEETKEEPKGGSYYLNQATYLGDQYLRLVFGKHYDGKLSLEEVADYLGVRAKSVAGLEEIILRKAASE